MHNFLPLHTVWSASLQSSYTLSIISSEFIILSCLWPDPILASVSLQTSYTLSATSLLSLSFSHVYGLTLFWHQYLFRPHTHSQQHLFWVDHSLMFMAWPYSGISISSDLIHTLSNISSEFIILSCLWPAPILVSVSLQTSYTLSVTSLLSLSFSHESDLTLFWHQYLFRPHTHSQQHLLWVYNSLMSMTWPYSGISISSDLIHTLSNISSEFIILSWVWPDPTLASV